jgi:glucose-6-phosphate isomerase, archaeal
MIDLHETSGLPLSVDDSQLELPLRLDGVLQPGELKVRALAELQPALADPSASGPDPAYFMYRGVCRLQGIDPETLRAYRFRYDVTIFPPAQLGREFLRTIGHYHRPIRAGAPSYPEVYEVLSGVALFLLQKVDDIAAGPDETHVEEFVAVAAKAGAKAMMLPDYGHWTVNATPEPLIVSNWICEDCESCYGVMARTRGPCVYVVAESGKVGYVRNGLYGHPPETIGVGRPADVPALGLVRGYPIFADLVAAPARWRYLCEPEDSPVDLRSAMEVTAQVSPRG